MNRGKNQNSILVLATLGVYLGLVLVGATPQVWAQAATAKQFSVKDEVETSDKLDNDPDDCRIGDIKKIRELEAIYPWFNDRSIDEYAGLVESIVNTYSKIGALTIHWKSVGEVKQTRSVSTISSLVGADRSLDNIGFDVILAGNGLPGKSFSFSAEKDDSGHLFRFTSHALSYDQPLVRYLYGSALKFHQCSDHMGNVEVILRNTEVKVEDRNLIISTRLPRGSLDSLLASNAK